MKITKIVAPIDVSDYEFDGLKVKIAESLNLDNISELIKAAAAECLTDAILNKCEVQFGLAWDANADPYALEFSLAMGYEKFEFRTDLRDAVSEIIKLFEDVDFGPMNPDGDGPARMEMLSDALKDCAAKLDSALAKHKQKSAARE